MLLLTLVMDQAMLALKKLYDMMDRIRKARHGTTEQPPEIQAERLMPA
jgi:hypothetical protein